MSLKFEIRTPLWSAPAARAPDRPLPLPLDPVLGIWYTYNT